MLTHDDDEMQTLETNTDLIEKTWHTTNVADIMEQLQEQQSFKITANGSTLLSIIAESEDEEDKAKQD